MLMSESDIYCKILATCNFCIMLYNVCMEMKDFIKIEEAAKLLNVTKMTLRRWDKAGKLKAYRHPMNNYRLYKKVDIENILRSISDD